MSIKVGTKVKDAISGFSGVVVARTEWLNGCIRLTVQPEMAKDGKFVEAVTFDEPQLVALGAHDVLGRIRRYVDPFAPGGDRSAPLRAVDPTR